MMFECSLHTGRVVLPWEISAVFKFVQSIKDLNVVRNLCVLIHSFHNTETKERSLLYNFLQPVKEPPKSASVSKDL